MAGQQSLDVYVCHGVTDAGWVRVLAGHLFQAGLTAYLGPWEPDGADLMPRRLSEGCRQTRCAVLVVGPSTPDWVVGEYRAARSTARSTASRPMVVVSHGERELPDLGAEAVLVDFRGVDASAYRDRVRVLVELLGPPAVPPADRAPGRSALLRLTPDRVTGALFDDPESQVSAAITVAGDRASRWSRQRREPEALRAMGTALGATFTPDPVGRMLEDAAGEAAEAGGALRIGVDATGDLTDLPWETLILPGHTESLALHPATLVYRAEDPPGHPLPAYPPLPGPLRILAVLASPDSGSLVDFEREMAALIAAVEPARRHHGARVRILNEGTLPAIRAALAQEPAHVLHLSCPTRPGAVVLEAGDGHADSWTPAALFTSLFVTAPAVRPPGLVVFSGGWAAQPVAGSGALSALVRSVLAAGIPQVVAMTAPVTDRYASTLCAGLYRELALAPEPEVLPALAHARRDAEHQRRLEAARTGRPVPAEWATPALYQRGRPGPLYQVASAPSPRTAEPAPSGFVGRRGDLRRLLTALRQPDTAGVVLYGLAGAGKSAMAAEAVRRLGPHAGVVVSCPGTVTARDVLDAVSRALAARTGIPAGDEPTDVDRPASLDGLAAVLTRTPMLLLLDHGEDSLVRAADGSWVLADLELARVLAVWAARPGRGRILITSRHPFELRPTPGRLRPQHVGPLSWSEARLLMWQLGALDTLSPTEQHKSYVDTGGNPGTLTLVDTLLRRPGADFTDLRHRLERLLRDRRIDRPELWMAQVGKQGVDATLAEAVTSAVYDTLKSDALIPESPVPDSSVPDSPGLLRGGGTPMEGRGGSPVQ